LWTKDNSKFGIGKWFKKNRRVKNVYIPIFSHEQCVGYSIKAKSNGGQYGTVSFHIKT
jgi:cystathionine beta-lyase/cystathionine gamma-synthase